jgi:hypothetical protein
VDDGKTLLVVVGKRNVVILAILMFKEKIIF